MSHDKTVHLVGARRLERHESELATGLCPSPAPPKVPWVVSWSGELQKTTARCRTALGRRAVVQPCNPGQGAPVFAELHVIRHREAINDLRCIVCGERTPREDRWLVPLGFWFEDFAGQLKFSTEPPMHERCLDYSLNHCPDLKKKAFKKARLAGDFECIHEDVIRGGRRVVGRGRFWLDFNTAVATFGIDDLPPLIEPQKT